MRGFRALFVGAVLTATLGAAFAKPAAPRPPAPVTTFWGEIIEPHRLETKELLEKARQAIRTTDDAVQADGDWSVAEYMRYFEDAYYLMRYARTLAPDNTDVLAVFARAAVELGKTREATEALERALRVTGPDRAPPDIVAELGALQLRRGDRAAAIRTLRLAQGPTQLNRAPALFHLANALAADGDISGAIDVISSALPPTIGYYSADVVLLLFTKGVIYDRDEQGHAAFEILDKLRAAQGTAFMGQLQTSLQLIRFAPAEDQHYYLGLLYEINQQFVEARAAFAAYAACGDTPWRRRALEHIRAIDQTRRTVATKRPPVTTTPTPAP